MSSETPRELYSYKTSWPVYGLNWSQRPGTFRMGLGSFVPDRSNKIMVIELEDRDGDFVRVDEIEQQYPCTKLMWSPDKSSTSPDLFATTGDFLRIWQMTSSSDPDHESQRRRRPPGGQVIAPVAVLKNQRRTDSSGREFHAPITSMDWNETDPSMVITSSIDTTCTIWDISTQQAKTQLIAHDREVYDVAFSRGSDVFASVGADGSLRMFDLRNLEHSTILYEAGPVPSECRIPISPPSSSNSNTTEILPLLRLAWNKQDPSYIATFQTDSSAILVMDIRVPAIPVAELRGHASLVTAVGWAPHSGGHLCSTGDDKQALIWDISAPTPTSSKLASSPTTTPSTSGNNKHIITDPILAYSADEPISQMSWSAAAPDWVAVSAGCGIQALRV
ncbi:WD40-repeat-containing domain protein [Fimicolochytrium jonesii]|uniref:WD40-repeat-containing domain protein n=1 Tax=Fimicolochytrium jonesii TaxID=1396493 RepID=UPI0022FEFB8D|nr:WD40-repeat-containing domain protein [Fimicolochytrium jonesii]KAI8823157.1 WD40-repeat-containing domain protein [Fimicolochytrium jonesii]